MKNIPTPLIGLWVAITLPVIIVGGLLYVGLKKPADVVYKTKNVVVSPTATPTIATPSATPLLLHGIQVTATPTVAERKVK